jgi:CDP-diacylglycerol--glycerol-3-phosphate 3-phosphatidyltransferase
MIPLLVLLGAAVALLVVTVVTARRPAEPVPDFEGYLERWSALHEGYDPRGSFFLRGWLEMTFWIARPLAKVGVLPDMLTIWSIWLACAVLPPAIAGGRWQILAGWLLVVSGLGDTLDGCVAALTNRATRWGYVLDSLVDRVNDVIYLIAVWVVGGPAVLAVVAGVLLFLQEYTRARAGNAGLHEVGVVTIAERATRVIICSASIHFGGVFLGSPELVATVGLVALTGMALIALGQIVVHVRRRLLAPAGPVGSGAPGETTRDGGAPASRHAGPTSSATIRADSTTSGSPPPGCEEPPTRNSPRSGERFAGRRNAERGPFDEVP